MLQILKINAPQRSTFYDVIDFIPSYESPREFLRLRREAQ